MKIANFHVGADIVGQRIHVTWDYILEGTETLADIPSVKIRRKTRDFEFPPPAPNEDLFLLYDSASYRSDVIVTEVPGWEQTNGATRTTVTVTSFAKSENTCPVEIMRCTIFTIYDSAGIPIQRHMDILDAGGAFGRLVPGTTYYYQLFSSSIPADTDVRLYRASATATRSYGLNRTLYESLPAVYRRHDVITRAATSGNDGIPKSIPEAAPRSGQLRRFLDPFGLALDFMRSTAENLRDLRDIDSVDYRYLPYLAQWIGWNLRFDADIPLQRNEIKNATRLYRGSGTIPTLRAIVSRYTGWYTQVAEFAQHISRANQFPQFNIYGLVETADDWRGSDDASVALGFGNGHDTEKGGGDSPAALKSSRAEPFALHSGMRLSITVDGLLTEAVCFKPGDFRNITTATAAEVASAIKRTFSALTSAPTDDGHIELRSHTVGLTSSLQVNPLATSMITLEGALQGRLSTVLDTFGRVRLFFETTDPIDPRARQLYYKTFSDGAWGNAIALPSQTGIPQGAPAAVEISPGQIQLAWIDYPYTDRANIRTMQGTTRPRQPARLISRRTAPFTITSDVQLSFRGNGTASETVVLATSAFPEPKQATVEQVVQLINAKSTHIVASALPNGAFAFETKDAGPQARLEIELSNSAGTQALGFDAYNNKAQGSWSDEIDWGDVKDVDMVKAGRHADLHMLRDASGTVWLFWATHVGSNWNIVSSRFAGGTWSPPETLADAPGGNREPYAVLDANNRIWLFWSHRQGTGTREDIWILQRRIYDPVTAMWSSSTEDVTPPPPTNGQATDREPSAILLPDGSLRLFFRSNRAGGTDLWSGILDTNGVSGVLTAITGGRSSTDSAPAPVALTDGSLLLLYRSDGNVSLAQVAPQALPEQVQIYQAGSSTTSYSSIPVPDAGSLRRFAGTTSAVPNDIVRNSQRRLWGDMLTYTPQKPQGGLLQNDDLYTRNTIGLYISQANSDMPLTQKNIARLHQLLQEFLPINIRAVIILNTFGSSEYLYPPNAYIREDYQDKYPYINYYDGLIDTTAAALPDWRLFHSNTPSDVTADPADLATLRSRTYFPPPQ